MVEWNIFLIMSQDFASVTSRNRPQHCGGAAAALQGISAMIVKPTNAAYSFAAYIIPSKAPSAMALRSSMSAG
jgi:hypothetical protein